MEDAQPSPAVAFGANWGGEFRLSDASDPETADTMLDLGIPPSVCVSLRIPGTSFGKRWSQFTYTAFGPLLTPGVEVEPSPTFVLGKMRAQLWLQRVVHAGSEAALEKHWRPGEEEHVVYDFAEGGSVYDRAKQRQHLALADDLLHRVMAAQGNSKGNTHLPMETVIQDLQRQIGEDRAYRKVRSVKALADFLGIPHSTWFRWYGEHAELRQLVDSRYRRR